MAAVVDMTIVAESSPVEICHDLANDKLEKVFLAIEEAAVRRALEEESSVSTVRTQQKSLDEKMERKVIIEEKPVELSPTASTSDEYVAPLDANASSNAIQAKKYRRRTSICVSRVGTYGDLSSAVDTNNSTNSPLANAMYKLPSRNASSPSLASSVDSDVGPLPVSTSQLSRSQQYLGGKTLNGALELIRRAEEEELHCTTQKETIAKRRNTLTRAVESVSGLARGLTRIRSRGTLVPLTLEDGSEGVVIGVAVTEQKVEAAQKSEVAGGSASTPEPSSPFNLSFSASTDRCMSPAPALSPLPLAPISPIPALAPDDDHLPKTNTLTTAIEVESMALVKYGKGGSRSRRILSAGALRPGVSLSVSLATSLSTPSPTSTPSGSASRPTTASASSTLVQDQNGQSRPSSSGRSASVGKASGTAMRASLSLRREGRTSSNAPGPITPPPPVTPPAASFAPLKATLPLSTAFGTQERRPAKLTKGAAKKGFAEFARAIANRLKRRVSPAPVSALKLTRTLSGSSVLPSHSVVLSPPSATLKQRPSARSLGASDPSSSLSSPKNTSSSGSAEQTNVAVPKPGASTLSLPDPVLIEAERKSSLVVDNLTESETDRAKSTDAVREARTTSVDQADKTGDGKGLAKEKK